ncbi:hypothetical protein [Nocardioides conyzicola]|uniref:Uncharacterized protein n=1 Tax=Nocardioides conyzicola TaxID=1651781 RepID=A0ABP8XC07_9ACTN
MGLRKNKSILDQAGDTVSEYVEQVKPQLEAAFATARDKAGPVLADARDKAGPVIADARAKAAPYVADARDKSGAYISDARDKAGPAIAAGAAVAAEKIAAGAAAAAEFAADAAESAADKVAEVAEPKKKGSKLKKLVLITGLAAAAAFVVSRLKGGKQSENWQSSYTPTPAPAPTPAPTHAAVVTEDDEAGAAPGEALADKAESPHPVTTPDDPADVVEVDDKA